jgi:hypothetical protein
MEPFSEQKSFIGGGAGASKVGAVVGIPVAVDDGIDVELGMVDGMLLGIPVGIIVGAVSGVSPPASLRPFVESSLQARADVMASRVNAQARGRKTATELFMAKEAPSLARLYIRESTRKLLRARTAISRRSGKLRRVASAGAPALLLESGATGARAGRVACAT